MSLSRSERALRPLLIMVAPNGARHQPADHPALPVTIDAVAETAAACLSAGAGAIHAHVRDADGRHLLDADAYRALLARIERAAPTIVTQVTTESAGRYAPAEQATLLADLKPRFASVAIREVFGTGEEAGAETLRAAEAAGTACQYILYDDRDILWYADLAQRAMVPPGRHRIILVFGRYTAGESSTVEAFAEALATLTRLGLADSTVWTVCAFGQGETAVLEAAMAAGGHVRVGFENSFLHGDGRVAADNAERVAVIASLAREMGRPLAMGLEAASILGAMQRR